MAAVIDRLVYVAELVQIVVRSPFIGLYPSVGLNRMLNDGDEHYCVSLRNEFHEELLGRQVHSTENPLGRNGATLRITWLATSNH